MHTVELADNVTKLQSLTASCPVTAGQVTASSPVMTGQLRQVTASSPVMTGQLRQMTASSPVMTGQLGQVTASSPVMTGRPEIQSAAPVDMSPTPGCSRDTDCRDSADMV